MSKDLNEAKKELQKFKKDGEKLNNQKLEIEAKLNLDDSEYQRKIKEIERKRQNEIKVNTNTFGVIDSSKETKINNKYDNQIANLGINMEKEIANADYELRKIEEQLTTTKNKQDEWNSKVDELNLKLAKSQGLDDINEKIDGINNSIKSTIRKVSKWTLAIFGIRSAYTAIRSAMGTISQYDDKMSANVNYMKYVLANTIKPLIEWIIKAGYSILGFVGRIVYLLTGKNIFKNSGIKDFEKSMKNSSKNAKDIKKTLLGFDELNVLDDSSSNSSDFVLPNQDFDLSNVANYKSQVEIYIEELIGKWFNLGEEMKNALSNTKVFDDAFGIWSLFIQGVVQLFLGLWKVITGTVEILGGILDIIVGIFTGNFELIKEGWDALVNGFINLLSGAVDLIVGIIKILVGLIIGILGEAWSGIKSILSTITNFVKLYVITPISKFCDLLWSGIISGVKGAANVVKNVFSSVVTFFKKIISTIVSLFKTIGTKVGNVIASAFKLVINGILAAIENILNFPIKSVNKLLDVINKVPGINISRLSTFNLPRMATGGIVDVPRRGVNIGGAIAGEAGAEGVLPLTDSDTMARLGQEIGKWITLNIDLVGKIDMRVFFRAFVQYCKNQQFNKNGGW